MPLSIVHCPTVMLREISKGEDGVLNAGDGIEYRMDVTNAGNTCLMDVQVDDGGLTTIPCHTEYAGQRFYVVFVIPWLLRNT